MRIGVKKALEYCSPYFRAVIAALFITGVIAWIVYPKMEFYLCVTMKSPLKGEAQLYYDTGDGLSESNSVRVVISGDDTFHDYLFQLPKIPILNIRFDPPSVPGIQAIRNITIRNSVGRILKEINLRQLRPAYQVKRSGLINDVLEIVVEDKAVDPQISVALDNPLKFIRSDYLPGASFVFKGGTLFFLIFLLIISFFFIKKLYLKFLPLYRLTSRTDQKIFSPDFTNISITILNRTWSIKELSLWCLLFLTWAFVIMFFGMKVYPFFKYSGRTIIMEMRTSVPGLGQVFFNSGNGYNEGESFSFPVRPTIEFMQYSIPIPETNILSMRFDPIDAEGPFEIRRIFVKTRDESFSLKGDTLARQIVSLVQMRVAEMSPHFSGYATGIDPSFSVEGLSCPANYYNLLRTLIAYLIFLLAIVLLKYLAVFTPRLLRRTRLMLDNIINRKRLILPVAAFLLSLIVILIVHRGAWVDYVRYSRVAEGTISHAIHSILIRGVNGVWELAEGDASFWGRVRPAHWLNYTPPYLATMVRNGDLFHPDPSYPWYNRMNGDLQTHTLYLLVLLSFAVAFGMIWIYNVTGSLFAILLFPILASGSLTVCENLLVNYADSQDIPQLFWIMLYIFLLRELLRNKHKWGFEILSYVALVFAYFTKETSIVLGIAFGFYFFVKLFTDDTLKRRFFVRQLLAHGILVVVLVSLVLTFISGRYVAENLAIGQQGLNARLLFAWSSLSQGLFSPVFLCIGIGALLIYVIRRYLRKPIVNADITTWLEIVLPLLMFAGFFVLALQWKGMARKYYIVVMFFGSLATCMLLGIVIHYLRFPQKRWTCWILIMGSLIFLFKPAGKIYEEIQSFYLESYGYRKSIPLVAGDISRIVQERQFSVTSVHLVLNKLFQEDELAFVRYINKVKQLNLLKKGRAIQKIDAIERNYFRIFPGRHSVEISALNQVSSPVNADFIYVITRGMSLDQEGLNRRGFVLENFWDLGSGCGEVYRFRPTPIVHP